MSDREQTIVVTKSKIMEIGKQGFDEGVAAVIDMLRDPTCAMALAAALGVGVGNATFALRGICDAIEETRHGMPHPPASMDLRQIDESS